MDLLGTILTSVAGGAATQVGRNLYDWLKHFLNDALADKSEADIVEGLRSIGNLADIDIRRRVDEYAQFKKLTAGEAQDLCNLIVNLAHGLRFHTTSGSLRSSFVRCGRHLDQLLNRVLPKRKIEEPVAANGMPGWKLTRFLGMGSFGEVWEVRNPDHPERRAVKFFTSSDSNTWITAEQKTLFQVQGKLPKHPNLVSFLDVALNGKPFGYLVLEYADGGSLEEWILRQHADRAPLDRLALMEGIVRGLAQAHECGIAHRDLKPANILLTGARDPIPKIADFGLGRVSQPRPDAAAQSSMGMMVGTTMYLPPEALQPLLKRSDAQDDVFAVGVIWYQLLVDQLERPPYDFANRLREHLVDSQTIRVIERCLAQPDRRYTDAGDLEANMPLPVPIWDPVPPEYFDVQHLAREYLASKT